MKYYKLIYHNLITKSKLRGLDKSKLEGYYECHHIIPRSMGGSDLPENLVLLTAREHFLAHWLLTKFTSGNDRVKMLYALSRMGNGLKEDRKLTARQYAISKKANSEATSIQNKSRAEAGLHWTQSPEGRQVQSERMSIKVKAQVEAGAHPWQSPEARLYSTRRMVDLNKVKVACKHCGKSTSPGQIGRNHGDKCKLLTEIGSHCLLTDKPSNWKVCTIEECNFGCCGTNIMSRHINKYHN